LRVPKVHRHLSHLIPPVASTLPLRISMSRMPHPSSLFISRHLIQEGAFASREFQRGDLILAEKPIFSIRSDSPREIFEAKVLNLSPHHLDRFLSLHNSHTACSCFENPALGTFATNAFALDEGKMGICLTAARFYHSCPNARHTLNTSIVELQLSAFGTIPAGEEIFVTYAATQSIYGNPRRKRQDLLRARDHFTCACSVCSLPSAESEASDTIPDG